MNVMIRSPDANPKAASRPINAPHSIADGPAAGPHQAPAAVARQQETHQQHAIDGTEPAGCNRRAVSSGNGQAAPKVSITFRP
jgi:hypothetical protein